MGGYTKNIAVIRGIKQGFSADGGELSGLVKVEKYGSRLRAEISKINFAPLAEGKYAAALSDGKNTLVFDGDLYEGESALAPFNGFAVLICYVNGAVQPLAAAVCGNFGGKLSSLKAEVERAETVVREERKPEKYEDEAIAEVNYYEKQSDEADAGGDALRENEKEEEDGQKPEKDETAVGAVEKARGIKLAGGAFYQKMKTEIEGLFKTYPAEEELCKTVENSEWVKISYGDGKHYVFGVIYEGKTPRYLAYGVPAESSLNPPESMKKLASFIPTAGGGWWMTYQDAETGAAIKLEIE